LLAIDRKSLLFAIFAAIESFILLVSAGFHRPVLRHDWTWFPFVGDSHVVFSAALGGWTTDGFGSPEPYPIAYLFGVTVATLRQIVGGDITYSIVIFVVAFICATGSAILARELNNSTLGILAAMIFAVFNPWFYNKLVAGHVVMLAAFGATFWLAASLIRGPKDRRSFLISSLLAIQQIQFAILAFPMLLYLGFRKRQALPIITVVIVLLPIVLGLIGNHNFLLQAPYTVAWESDQSIRPLDAITMTGYFTHYADHFVGLSAIALWVIASLAFVGSISSFLRFDKIGIFFTGLTFMFLAVSMGTRGPNAEAFIWAVRHIPESGVFRELYDLIGLVVLGYIILTSIAIRRFPILSIPAFTSTAVIAVFWFLWPPSALLVPSVDLPTINISTSPNSRFVLLPPFQPLNFGGRGSGSDPDSFGRLSNITPLNEYYPSFPVSTALAAYQRYGDTRALSGLSVSVIYNRPWLATRSAAFAGQVAFEPDSSVIRRDVPLVQRVEALPELSLIGVPEVGTLDNIPGSGSIFFGDAAVAAGKRAPKDWTRFRPVQAVVAPNNSVHANEGWVDARFAFTEIPQLGQGFGGALTTSAHVSLRVQRDRDALVWIRGRLVATSGRTIVSTTAGYKWVHFGHDVDSVLCIGMCTIAVQGTAPEVAPLNPIAQEARTVSFKAIFPWLIEAQLPPGKPGALRYNVAFDDHWIAFSDSNSLLHIRLDTMANGWLLPVRAGWSHLLIIQSLVALQILFELIGMLWLVILTVFLMRKRLASSVRHVFEVKPSVRTL